MYLLKPSTRSPLLPDTPDDVWLNGFSALTNDLGLTNDKAWVSGFWLADSYVYCVPVNENRVSKGNC